MARNIPRVGFDFDGVVAYNPLRVFRRPVMMVAKLFRREKESLHFPYPKSSLVKWFWERAHRTSFFPSRGFSRLRELLGRGDIEGYIITGRYAFLNDELYDWLRHNKVDGLFKHIYVNMNDEQPHLFKERMIKKLNLDYFVEDNWDIVQYLNSKFKIKSSRQITNSNVQNSKQNGEHIEIHWIYNILDKFNTYPHKHPYLESFLNEITGKK